MPENVYTEGTTRTRHALTDNGFRCHGRMCMVHAYVFEPESHLRGRSLRHSFIAEVKCNDAHEPYSRCWGRETI